MQIPEYFPRQPQSLWSYFYNFTQIPRPSKKEEKIVNYLVNLAKSKNLAFKVDSEKNIVIYVPAKGTPRSNEPVIIQNHVDMVTDAASGYQFNFETQPIETFVKDGYLKAKQTTLGADNGIGCAAALALIDAQISHPPLELLFTTDEETGLNGATNLDASMLTGSRMINLDTEEWGSLYIGCAGGIDYEMTGEFEIKSVSGQFFELKISQLIGGHSGIDIHLQRANAIKLLADFIYSLRDLGIAIVSFDGGVAHNIIPRGASCIFSLEKADLTELERLLALKRSEYESFLSPEDQKFEIELFEAKSHSQALTSQASISFIKLLKLFPHGAHSIDRVSAVVGTSNNLAKVKLVNGQFYLMTSLRFMGREEIFSLEHNLETIAELFGMNLRKNSEYPSWKPASDNKLLEQVKSVFAQLFSKPATVTAIHAGLECGIIRDKIGPIDVVSFGPTIMGAHSPDERVDIESVEHFWKLLINVMERI